MGLARPSPVSRATDIVVLAERSLGRSEQETGEGELVVRAEPRARRQEHRAGHVLRGRPIPRPHEDMRMDAPEAGLEALFEAGAKGARQRLGCGVPEGDRVHRGGRGARSVPGVGATAGRLLRAPGTKDRSFEAAGFYKANRWASGVTSLGVALVALACASPRASETSGPPPVAPPVVVDARGPVPAARAEGALARAAAGDALRRRAHSLSGAVQARTGTPLVWGNRTRLLVDGPSTNRALLAAIARARDHVHVETYIFADDAVGRRFARALVRKRREGVVVRVIYDAVGSRASDPAFFAALEARGVEVAAYRPLRTPWIWRLNNRDHRKLVVIDGRVAFTGGVNISGAYAEASSTRPGRERGVAAGWRDTHLEIRGPAVRLLQALFVQTWARLGRSPLRPAARLFPELGAEGPDLVQVIASEGGDESEFRIYGAYLGAIRKARVRIWISQAYFAPNAELRAALAAAADRGVDVRVIVPAFTDSALVHYAARATYQGLLDRGVAIYEHEPALLHAKTAVVDGVWSTVGSANLDTRSFVHNDELNVAVVGAGLAREMEAWFLADLASSRRIDPQRWRERPLRERIKERLSRLFSHWL
jgi:cardiolipin synthase